MTKFLSKYLVNTIRGIHTIVQYSIVAVMTTAVVHARLEAPLNPDEAAGADSDAGCPSAPSASSTCVSGCTARICQSTRVACTLPPHREEMMTTTADATRQLIRRRRLRRESKAGRANARRQADARRKGVARLHAPHRTSYGQHEASSVGAYRNARFDADEMTGTAVKRLHA